MPHDDWVIFLCLVHELLWQMYDFCLLWCDWSWSGSGTYSSRHHQCKAMTVFSWLIYCGFACLLVMVLFGFVSLYLLLFLFVEVSMWITWFLTLVLGLLLLVLRSSLDDLGLFFLLILRSPCFLWLVDTFFVDFNLRKIIFLRVFKIFFFKAYSHSFLQTT